MGLGLRCAYVRSLGFKSWFSSTAFKQISPICLSLALLLSMSVRANGQSKTPTTTTLALTTNGGSNATVALGTVVTLTATVSPTSGAMSAGQVNFCDASANYCSGIHLLGTAQLTSAGVATLKVRPGTGSHLYEAVFLGTKNFALSTSGTSALTVTETIPQLATSTTINQTGSWGTYMLSATVTETGNITPPAGAISFVDTNHGNTVLGAGTLGASTRGVAWTNVNTSAPSIAGTFYAVTDLNQDGIPDLFFKDYFGTYDVLIGNGDGTFTVKGSPFGPSSETGTFVVGDFNNDGIPDVAAINAVYYASTNAITIFLGNGDGTFAVAGSSPAIGMSPGAIATADINGDGNSDLIVSQQDSSGNGQIVILFGNGDGTFTQAPSMISATSIASSITPVDLNGDGKIDLVLSGITVLMGEGDGTFTTVAGPTQAGESTVVVADLNDDGIPDLAFPAPSTSYLTVFLGNGDGTFTQAPSSPNANLKVGSLTVADFNQDGIVDLVYSVPNTTTASVSLGNGDGTFTQTPGTLNYSYDFSGILVAADFNGDGWPDVLTEDGNSRTVIDSLTQPTETAIASANVSVPLAGTHLADASYSGNSNYSASVSSAISLWGAQPATGTTLTLTSGGDAVTIVAPGTAITLTATVIAGASPLTAGQVNFCDASASFCTDIHVLGTSTLTSNGTAIFKFVPGVGAHSYKAVFVENGYGLSSTSNVAALTVGPAPSVVYSDTTSITSGGLPGNYSLTATVEGFGGSAAPTGSVSFLDTSFGNTSLATAQLGAATSGLGWIISQTPVAGGNIASEVAGDFNGDGIPDLALLWNANTFNSPPYSITILFGNGKGSFTAGPTTAVTGAQSYASVSAGDWNGDGKTDLIILSYNGSSISYVTSLLGNGDGTFGAPQTGVAFNQGAVGGDVILGSIVTADFNGDGKVDLAIVGDYVSTGGITVLLGNGDGTFTAAGANLAPNQGFGVVATGDFNGDGILDLVAANYFEPGGATIFLGKGDGTFVPSATPLTIDSFTKSMVVGDFNADGVLDLAIGYSSGVNIFLGKGDGTFQQTAQNSVSGSGISLVAGDFNQDGKLDLAGIDNYNDQIDLFLGAGDGSFAESVGTPNVGQTALGPFAIVVEDLNEDGVPDLALLTNNASTATILLTEPTETASVTVNNIAPVGAGTHNVEASYSSDSNYSAGISSTVALTAGLAPLTITPAPGTYSSTQTVTITESLPGATIYYSASGILNTNGFIPYTGPIALTEGGVETIQAYATETGYQQSDYAYETYTLNLPPAATPTISPAAGYYAGKQTVTINDSDSTASIYYMTNGTTPDVTSNLYSGPITVSSSETLVAVAISSGHSYSAPAVAQYLIGSSTTPLIYTVAGSGSVGYTGDGGQATLAQLGYAYSVAEDASGNLYLADEDNHVVRKVAAGTGVITTIAGNGFNGYTGDGGQATAAELSYPTNLTLDNAGNLFIGDISNSTVREVNLNSGIITTYAGNPNATLLGDGGPATAALLNGVTGLALDASQNLYIASYFTIRQVNHNTGIITTIAGNGSPGYSGDGGPATNASFYGIYSLVFDASGNLYIADSFNNLIRKITATNGVITSSSIVSTVAGTVPQSQYSSPVSGYSGDGGPATSAKLNLPYSVAVDSAGNIFIADSSNNAIRQVTSSNSFISTVAGNGTCTSLGGDGGAATGASICLPIGLTVDSRDNMFIADDLDRVREVVQSAPPASQAAAPTFSVAAGTYASPQSLTISDTTPGASIYVTVDGSTPTTGNGAGYSLPIGITGTVTVKTVVAAPGYLNSAPTSASYTVTAFSPTINTVAGGGAQDAFATSIPALDMQLARPWGVAFDKTGSLYVSDLLNNVVWQISASTGIASIYAGSGYQGSNSTGDGGPATSATLDEPEGLAFDGAGNLYIADSAHGAIRKVTAATGIISTVAGQYYPYQFSGDGGPATSASLLFPSAVAFDGAGNLYIADEQDSRIREVSATTGIITTVAGNGNTTDSGDGGLATSAGLDSPNALAVDLAGNIYIGESYEGRVRKVAAETGQINTYAGFDDIPGNTGDGGPAVGAQVSPNSLALDSAGNLYIANGNSEIREINASTGIISRVAGIGYSGFTGDGGAAAVAEISSPEQIAFDPTGNLYFADYSGRVRKVTFTEQAARTPVFSLPSGSYAGAQSVTITDSVPNATIYYTTDGSAPSASSNVYTSAITVSASETINAMATAVDYNPSAVATATYVISAQAPVPSITSLSPASSTAGSSSFTLTVDGAGFTSASTVNWGSSSLSTQFVSSTQLTATVPAANLATAGIISLTVQTPAPGGGTSNTFQFEVDTAGSATPPSFSPTSVTVSAGGTATYMVTLPASATNVSVQCLNLPAGAACNYSSSSGALTITTTSSTPSGTFAITVVFTETLSGSAAALILMPFLIFPVTRNRGRKRYLWLLAASLAITILGATQGCGNGGGNTGGINPPPATHRATGSGVVNLTVK